jgi:poly-gamma-glutamate synthesis protein (capsule biosynthesis protein)
LAVRGLLIALLAVAIGGPPALASEPDPRNGRITISVSGDLLIHESVMARARALGGGEGYEFEPLFEGVRPWIERPDLAFCHVETPITDLVAPTGRAPFNAPPEFAEAIAALGWDGCSIASNHSLDQGREGIQATGRALDRAGVGHTGAHVPARDRPRPLILHANGFRVALLSYTTAVNTRPFSPPGSVNLAGNPFPVVAEARRARRAGADVVLVNVHWTLRGTLWTPALRLPGEPDYTWEYEFAPGAGQVELVTSLIGRDEITAVIAQGPHVVQPIERVGGKYAVFSEGNLISGTGPGPAIHTGSFDGFIALLTLARRDGRVTVRRLRYVPVQVRRPGHDVVPARPGTPSYERTVAVAGRGAGIEPVPGTPPSPP